MSGSNGNGSLREKVIAHLVRVQGPALLAEAEADVVRGREERIRAIAALRSRQTAEAPKLQLRVDDAQERVLELTEELRKAEREHDVARDAIYGASSTATAAIGRLERELQESAPAVLTEFAAWIEREIERQRRESPAVEQRRDGLGGWTTKASSLSSIQRRMAALFAARNEVRALVLTVTSAEDAQEAIDRIHAELPVVAVEVIGARS